MVDRLQEADALPIAVLGGGLKSAVGRAHMTALAMDGRFEVVAGCFSIATEDNQQSAVAYGVANNRLYDSLEQMLERESQRVEAVLVLTPTDLHAEHVLRCLDANQNVICEKALAGTSDAVRRIQAAERRTNRFLAVTYNYLGYPMVRELKAMIAAGELGTVRQIFVEMPQEGFLRKQAGGEPVVPQAWRLRDGAIPTLSLDLGVHVHSLVGFLTNSAPRAVMAVQDSFGHFPDVIDNAVTLSRYESDILSTAWFSKSALGYRNGLKVRVFGDKAAAEWVQETPEIITFADSRGQRGTLDRGGGVRLIAQEFRYNRFKAGHPAGFIEAFANYYHDVADALIAHRSGSPAHNPYVFGSTFALEGAHWLEAIARSAQTKTWVDL